MHITTPLVLSLVATTSALAGPGDADPTDPNVVMLPRPRPVAVAPGGVAGDPTVSFLSVDADPEGDMPREVAFTLDGETAVVVNRDTDALTFFDVDSIAITDTVAIGDFPVDVAVTSDYAITANVLGDSVSIVSLATRKVVAEIPVTGTQPFAVEVTSDGALAVVAVINDGIDSSFSVIDLDALAEIDVIPSAGQGVIGFFFTPAFAISGNIFTQFALTPDDQTIVLPDINGDNVALYDLATGVETALLPVADAPIGIDISDDGSTAVFSHQGSTQIISVVDLVDEVVLDQLNTGVNLTSQVIRITPDETHAIAAISNNVIFVNLLTGLTTATINTGTVGDIEISFDGQYAFVSNFNSRVIDIASQSLVATLPLAPTAEAATSPVGLRAIGLNNRFREDVHLYMITGPSSFVEGFTSSGEAPEGDAPKELAIAPNGTTALVANAVSRNVCLLDLATETVTAHIDTGDIPRESAFTPDGQYALVCNGDSDTLSIIDVAAAEVIATLAVPQRPIRVRIAPDGSEAYVATVAGADRLYFIDLDGAASTVTGSFPIGQLGDFPIRVAFNGAGTIAYVANAFSDDVTVVDINGAASTAIDTINGIDMPLDMELDTDEAYLYVGAAGFQNTSVKVVDTATNNVVATIPLDGAPREGDFIDDESVYLVSTTTGSIARIDAAGPASSLLDEIPISGSPPDMRVSLALQKAIASQPGPDGLDIVSFAPAPDPDLNGDGTVDGADLGILLGSWGPCPGCPADLNGDGSVDGADLGILLGAWTAPAR